MRKWLNRLRANRDTLRISLSRWRYDRPRKEVAQVGQLRRIVFVRWDAKWGDSIVFSFVPAALKACFPDISVEVITTPEMAPLFRDHFGVDVVHKSVRRPTQRQMRDLAAEVGEIDLAVFFSNLIKPRDIYLLGRLQARHIASLDDSAELVDLKLGVRTHGQHMAVKYQTLLRLCGAGPMPARYRIPRDERTEAAVETWRQRLGSAPLVAFNAYSKGRARSLNPDTSRRLVSGLLDALPSYQVCVLSAPNKQQEVEALCAEFPEGRVVALSETRTIYDNIALIARCDALVSGITATVHIADGLDIPSLVLFPHDPEDCESWHSRHPQSVNLLARPGEPQDVNRLPWPKVEQSLARFCQQIAMRD